MLSETLTLWSNGAVTLPKEWRDRYATKHFLAKENEKGYLVIMPILDVEYWEEGKDCGLHFPHGMEMGEFVKLLDRLGKKMYGEEGYGNALKMAEKELQETPKRKKNGKKR